jgi:hypothetical protein
MGALIFAGAAWRIAQSEPSPVPAPTVTVQQSFGAIPTERAPMAEPVKASYVGNTNTHKFHKKSCHYAGCKNCTAKFATREEAIAAGYRPGGCCDP